MKNIFKLMFLFNVSFCFAFCKDDSPLRGNVGFQEGVMLYSVPADWLILIPPSDYVDFPKDKSFPLTDKILKIGFKRYAWSELCQASISIDLFCVSQRYFVEGFDVSVLDAIMVKEKLALGVKGFVSSGVYVDSAGRSWLSTDVYADSNKTQLLARACTMPISGDHLVNIVLDFRKSASRRDVVKGGAVLIKMLDAIEIKKNGNEPKGSAEGVRP